MVPLIISVREKKDEHGNSTVVMVKEYILQQTINE
jgi:hypothetical protein